MLVLNQSLERAWICLLICLLDAILRFVDVDLRLKKLDLFGWFVSSIFRNVWFYCLEFRMLLVSKFGKEKQVFVSCFWRKVRRTFWSKWRKNIQSSCRRISYVWRVLQWVMRKEAVNWVFSIVLIMDDWICQLLLAISVDMRIYQWTLVLMGYSKQVFLFQNLLCADASFLLFRTIEVKLLTLFFLSLQKDCLLVCAFHLNSAMRHT